MGWELGAEQIDTLSGAIHLCTSDDPAKREEDSRAGRQAIAEQKKCSGARRIALLPDDSEIRLPILSAEFLIEHAR